MTEAKINQNSERSPYPQTIYTLDFNHWHKCSEVNTDGELVRWKLAPNGYKFVDAYADDPHLQFLVAEDDGDLCSFIKMWGPPIQFLIQPEGHIALTEIYSLQNELLWWAHFLYAVEGCRTRMSEDSREDLAWVLSLDFNPARDIVLQFVADNEMASVLPSGIEAYVLTATENKVTDLVSKVVWRYRLPPLIPMLSVGRNGNLPILEEAYGFLGLPDALRWMLYKDTVEGRTIRFCDNCRSVLPPDKPKFCNELCRTRFHKRVWAAKSRAAKREMS